MSFPETDVGGFPTGWWQDGIYFMLCAGYASVSCFALIQMVRIELRIPGLTIQKLFHLMNFIVNGGHAVVFGLFLLDTNVLTLVVMNLLMLLFFSTYTLILLFWAEIYHQTRDWPTDNLKLYYVSVNSVIYFIQVCIWVSLWITDNSAVESIAKIFIAVVSFIAAFGYLLYGGRLFLMLKQFPLQSKGKSKKLREVGYVSVICITCFLIRCFVVGISAFDSDASLDVPDRPGFSFMFHTVAGILPSALVMYILRHLPPKRVSIQRKPNRFSRKEAND